MKSAALYVRVSTDKQTTANQLPELRALAERRGFEVADVFEETESGAKRRPILEKLLAKARSYDAVIVWALDRLGRGGALEALQIVGRLDRERVAVLSAQESWLDTSADNPMRDVLIAFSATVAKMERRRLIDRTNAGIARAKAEGKQLGRPRSDAMALAAALLRRQEGASYRAAVAGLGVSVAALRRWEAQTAAAAGPELGTGGRCAEKGAEKA